MSKRKNTRPRPPKVLRRRLVGLRVYEASGRAPPIVYALYEEDSYEIVGKKKLIHTTRLVRGDSIQTTPHSGILLNGTKKEKEYHRQALHPELYVSVQAASILCGQLERACLELDSARGKGEID